MGRVSSRIGLSEDGIAFTHADDLYALVERLHGEETIACVFVDEAQFLAKIRSGSWPASPIVSAFR